jgi:hypothetical protein
MQDRVDDPPIIRCPGCDRPMEAKERTPAAERLVDIRYVCAGCCMETKRVACLAPRWVRSLQHASRKWMRAPGKRERRDKRSAVLLSGSSPPLWGPSWERVEMPTRVSSVRASYCRIAPPLSNAASIWPSDKMLDGPLFWISIFKNHPPFPASNDMHQLSALPAQRRASFPYRIRHYALSWHAGCRAGGSFAYPIQTGGGILSLSCLEPGDAEVPVGTKGQRQARNFMRIARGRAHASPLSGAGAADFPERSMGKLVGKLLAFFYLSEMP